MKRLQASVQLPYKVHEDTILQCESKRVYSQGPPHSVVCGGWPLRLQTRYPVHVFLHVTDVTISTSSRCSCATLSPTDKSQCARIGLHDAGPDARRADPSRANWCMDSRARTALSLPDNDGPVGCRTTSPCSHSGSSTARSRVGGRAGPSDAQGPEASVGHQVACGLSTMIDKVCPPAKMQPDPPAPTRQ